MGVTETANLSYKINIDAELGQIQRAVANAKEQFKQLFEAGQAGDLQKELVKVGKRLDEIVEKTNGKVSVAGYDTILARLASIKTESTKVISELAAAQKSLDNRVALLPEKDQARVNATTKAVSDYAAELDKAKQKTEELVKAERKLNRIQQEKMRFTTAKEAAERALKEAEETINKNTPAQKAELESLIKKNEAIQQQIELVRQLKEAAKASGGDARKAVTITNPADGSTVQTTASAASRRLNKMQGEWLATDEGQRNAALQYQQLTQTVTELQTVIADYNQQLKALDDSETTAAANTKKLQETFERVSSTQISKAFTTLSTNLEKVGISLEDIPAPQTEEELKQLQETVTQFIESLMGPADEAFNTAKTNFEMVGAAANSAAGEVDRGKTAYIEENEAAKQVDGFVARIKQYTGLAGAAYVARRAIRSAFESIKELDAAMTEMAVVTAASVSDYWQQLPQYTQRANELGVTIKSVYESAGLYYQQGLKTNEVTAMTNATLKMARIAGLSAADATDKMTSALRGFNMEINEANAEKIADVYSELAAISASDTEEISSAMTKVASIAKSAGMEFETTAAFLAQGIEATREPAENIGTALKTVVARFQELKKAPSEIGEVDGEMVDANAIETALRSVGISLRDNVTGQFRNLDTVLLELSSKWNSIDGNTQRYIATIAAGSRQQSRFLAMISDYSRVMDLVNAANNSAGASSEQYTKTLDSLETKLAKLKNAWNTFTMGLANNEFIKVGIELLTKLLTVVNKLTQGWDSWSGSALKIAAVALSVTGLTKAVKAFKAASTAAGGSIAVGLEAAVTQPIRSFKTFAQALTNTIAPLAQLEKLEKTHAAALKQKKMAVDQLRQVQNNANATLQQQEAAMYSAVETIRTERKLNQQLISQKTIINTLTQNGVSQTVAQTLATQGLTQAQFEEMVSQKMATGLDRAAAVQQTINTLTTGANTEAITLNTLVQKSRILSLLQTIGWLVMGRTAELKDAAAKGTNTAATLLQTIANKGLAASFVALWAAMGPVLIGLAAIAAAIGVVILAWKGFKKVQKDAYNQSAQGRLEQAAQDLEAAADAAQRATENYTNLKDALSDLQGRYEVLDGLTKGTAEWNDQLLAINGTVLDLISKYKELGDSAYLTNDNGVLRLDIDAARQVIQARQMTALSAQNAQTMAQLSKMQAQERSRWHDLSREAQLGEEFQHYSRQWAEVNAMNIASGLILPVIGPAIANWAFGDDLRELRTQRDAASQAFTERVARQFAEHPPLSADEAKEIIASIDKSRATAANAEKLYQNRDELVKYGQELLQNDEIRKTLQSNLVSKAVQSLGAGYSEATKTAMTNFVNEDYISAIEKSLAESYEDIDFTDINGEYRQYWEGIYGADIKIDKKTGEITYLEDGETKTVGAATAKNQFIGAQTTEILADRLEQFPQLLQSLTTALTQNTKGNTNATAAQTALNHYFAKAEGAGLTRTDLASLSGLSDEDLREWYSGLNAAQKEAIGDIDTFIKTFRENISLANAAFDKAASTLTWNEGTSKEVKISLADFQLEAGQETALSNKLLTIANTSGIEAAQAIKNQISSLLSESVLSDADKQTFMQQFLTIDWQSIDALDKFQATLDGLNIAVDENRLDTLVENIKAMTNATRAFDLTKAEDQLKSLMTTAQKIASGEQTRNFDDETTQSLITAGLATSNNFVKQLDGSWNYIGNSMDELRQAIEDNTGALTEDAKRKLQSQIDAGNYLQNTDWIADLLRQRDELSNRPRRQGLENIRDNLLKQVGEQGLLDLDITDFSASTKFFTLSNDKIKTIWDKLAEVVSKIPANKTTLKGLDTLDTLTASAFSSIFDVARRALASETQASKQLLNRAINAGVSETFMRKYNKVMAEGNDLAKEQITIDLARRTLQAESEAGYKAMIHTLGELNDQYKYAGEGSQHYYEMISKIGETLKLDMTDNDNFDWVAKNLQLIRSAANGSAEAMAELQQKMIAIGKNPYYVSLEVIQTVAEQTDSWENPYTWLENLNEEINGIIQARTELENAYDATLADTITDTRTLLQLTEDQIAREKELAAEYQRRVDSLMVDITNQEDAAARQGWDKLYHIDGITGSIIVDPEAVEKAFAGDTNARDQFEKFITELKANRDAVRDNTNELYNSLKSNRQRLTTGRDSYITVMNDIKDQLVSLREDAIDRLQTINDTVTNQQSALLEEIRDNISEQRAQKELQKSIEDLADKQTRLAYLQLDTSGASDLEILKLQKEIADNSDDLQENLIDSALDSLESANEVAQKQREEQISIAEAQLEAYQQSPQIWSDAQIIYEQAMNAIKSGMGLEGTTYGQMLKTTLGNVLGSESGKKINETLQSLVESSVWTDEAAKNDILDVVHKLQATLQNYGITERGDEAVKDTGTKVGDTSYDTISGILDSDISKRMMAEGRIVSWLENQLNARWETDKGYKGNAAYIMDYGTLEEQKKVLSAIVREAGKKDIDKMGIQDFTTFNYLNNWKGLDATQVRFIWAELQDLLKRTGTTIPMPTITSSATSVGTREFMIQDNSRSALANQPTPTTQAATSTTTDIDNVYITIPDTSDPEEVAEAVADILLGRGAARFLVNQVQ